MINRNITFQKQSRNSSLVINLDINDKALRHSSFENKSSIVCNSDIEK